MNSFLDVLFFAWNIILLCVFLAGWDALMDKWSNWRYVRSFRAVPEDEDRLCTSNNDHHDWIKIKWREGEASELVTACSKCGSIPEKHCMANPKTLHLMRAWYHRNQLIDKIKEEFTEAEGEVVSKLAQAFVKTPTEVSFREFYQRAISTDARMGKEMETKVAEWEANQKDIE